MPDFIGTQNGQLSLPGIGTLGPLLLLGGALKDCWDEAFSEEVLQRDHAWFGGGELGSELRDVSELLGFDGPQ